MNKLHEAMLKAAIAIFILATAADAGEEAGLFEQGRQELRAKEFSRAVRSFEKALALSPEYGEGWTEFNLGLAYYGIKDWEKAASYFEKAFQRNPEKFSIYLYYYRNLGYSLFRQGKNEQALSIYEEGLKRLPEDEWLLEMAGWSLQRLGRKRVKKWQLIGRLGNSGNTTHPHLHIHCEYGDENQQVSRPCRFEGYPNLKEGDVVSR